MLIPLTFFPDWMIPGIELLPFRGLVDTPVSIYVGHLAGGQALSALLSQVIWTFILVLVGKLLLKNGYKRLAIQGG